jgi:hypothetical protein
MKIYIDITHPAEYNFFRNAIYLMKNNSSIDITIRPRGKLATIMDYEYGKSKYSSVGRYYTSFPGKIFGLIVRHLQLIKYCYGKKYDLYLGFGNFYPGYVSRVFNKPSIIFQDDCEYKLAYSLCKYSTDYLVIPNSIACDNNTLKYSGFKELAYLHPKYFTPNEFILKGYKLIPSEYVFVRETIFNSLDYKGIDPIKLEDVLGIISNMGLKAVVSLEEDKDLSNFKNCVVIDKSDDIFSIMHFALFTVSSGDSMVRESCLVGTPSIYTGKRNMSVNQELLAKGCMFKADNVDSFKEIVEYVVSSNIKQQTKEIINKAILYEWDDTTKVIMDILNAVYTKNDSNINKYRCKSEQP